MKILISPLQADSMINQANLFKKLLEESGFDVEMKSTITFRDLEDNNVKGAIWFQLATPPFVSDAVVTYLMSNNKPCVLYVTIEGVPKRGAVAHSNITRCQFVAVSNFVKDCLRSVGIKVKRVVHHAIDWKLCGEIEKYNRIQQKIIESKAKDKVRFIVVARDDPRKNLKGLADALKILDKKGLSKEFILFLITDETAKEKFEGLNNVVFLKPFGGSDHKTILGYIKACHYLIQPSFCEGFGLPVLEANAVGIPAIHCDMPPLNEFTSPDFNFMFNYIDKQLVKSVTQYWIFHVFPPDFLAEMIEFAIDVFKNNKDEYNEYCTKAREWTKEWDYRVKYVDLMDELKLPLPPWSLVRELKTMDEILK